MAARLWLYGDVACPWSYLALARIRHLARTIPIVVSWRPLTRSAGAPAPGRRAGLAEPEAGRTVPEPAEFARLAVPFDGKAGDFDSRNAMLALEFARDLGPSCLDRTLDGLFAAHFGSGVDLADRAQLLEVCGELGLDREALELSLEDGRYESELDRVEGEADRFGIDRIPTIIAGQSKIVGAAPLDVLESILNPGVETD
ncbi:MAG: DsbA family oxidoreductase [Gemmatimonadota bacterium]